MLNQCTFQGRLVADPELRYTGSNVPVCSFSIAIEQNRKNSNNETVTDFIPVVAWRSTAEFISKYFKKGKMILVSGSMRQRKYEKNGEKRTILECVVDTVNFCDSKREDSGTGSSSYGGEGSYSPYVSPGGGDSLASSSTSSDIAASGDEDAQLPF